MSDNERYEDDLLAAYEAGELKSVATKEELERMQAAARATRIDESRRPQADNSPNKN